jgi:DNA-binding GntR family transcriptional regulator
MPTTNAKRVPAKQVAYDYVRDLIVDTPLEEAAFITEGQIAAVLDISRTPVREAFLQLEAERFLQLMPKKGAYIPPISDTEMEEVIETRSVLESYAVRRLIADPDAIVDEVRQILEEQRRSGADRDAQLFIDLDRQFHQSLVTGVGNETLAHLYESLRDRQVRMGNVAIFSDPARFDQVLAEHNAIIDELANGDVEGVLNAVDVHLRTSLHVLLEAKHPRSWAASATRTPERR